MQDYGNTCAVDKQADIHDQYKICKQDFDNACRTYQNATMQRAEAEKRLQDITQKLAHNLNDGLADPTMPQAPQPLQAIGGGQNQGQFVPGSRY